MLPRAVLLPLRRTIFTARTPARCLHTCAARPTLQQPRISSLVAQMNWLRVSQTQIAAGAATGLAQQTRGMKVRSSVRSCATGVERAQEEGALCVYYLLEES